MHAKPSKTFKQYEGGDKLFLAACELANVKPTRRQHRRWRQERGQAFSQRNAASQIAA